jgi:ABC-type uncharacterized transport system substrate-binding protein
MTPWAKAWCMQIVALCALLFMLTIPARAGFDDSTVRIAARVLSFMDRPPTGVVTAGIIYAPDNPRSVADAHRLQEMLGNGLQVGGVTLKGTMVKITDDASAHVGLFFLTEDVGAAASQLVRVERNEHIPCITTDLAQVRDGSCAIGIQAEPRVEIIVNTNAANASAVKFSTVFRTLITEL